MTRREFALQRVHRFEHGGIAGAAIQVLESAKWDLNRMLPEELRLTTDPVVFYTCACHYLNLDGRHVMVDGGFYSHEVLDALAHLGVSPGDIELVLITHGDGDHVVGLLTPEEALTFPNARYVISQTLWAHWHDASALQAMSEDYRCFYQAFSSAIEDRLSVPNEEADVAPGVRFVPSPGHRHGHAVYEFRTEDTPIIHSGDTLFHPLFVDNPSWPDMMALNPEQEVANRRRLLERAAGTGALVLTGHMTFPGLGTIRVQAGAYRWQPTVRGVGRPS